MRARTLRQRIINQLGAACACCGEPARAVLIIDHAQDDGKQERARFPAVRAFYRHIIAQGVPRDHYQLLCHNCHLVENEQGECAHVAQARAILGLESRAE